MVAEIARRRAAAKKTLRNLAPFAVVAMTLIFWGTWLTFHSIAWMWRSFYTTLAHGSQRSLLRMNRAWTDFQAKIDAPDALFKLTTCLRDALPDRKATIADFTTCLEKMSMEDTM
jgi:hypothetical protein